MNYLNGGSGGVVICTASQAGLGAMPITPNYSATKFGVVGLGRFIRSHIAFWDKWNTLQLCVSGSSRNTDDQSGN